MKYFEAEFSGTDLKAIIQKVEKRLSRGDGVTVAHLIDKVLISANKDRRTSVQKKKFFVVIFKIMVFSYSVRRVIMGLALPAWRLRDNTVTSAITSKPSPASGNIHQEMFVW